MQPKISVVIPTWNRPALLAKCLQALAKQSMEPQEYEVIVVSDGPDETTASLVNAYSPFPASLLFFSLKKKKGPAAARNLGWVKARARLVAFTDDDCRPAANWLQAIFDAWQGEKMLVAYSGRVKVPVPAHPTDFQKNTANLEGCSFITANCACTKLALERSGGFDEEFAMAWREDSDLEFKLLSLNIPICRVPDALVIHPVRQAPWGISIPEQKKGLYNALLYKKFPRLYRLKIQAEPAWNYYLIVLLVFSCLFGLLLFSPPTAAFSGIAALILFTHLVAKRLHNTSRSFRHVAEMIVTSFIIPFASVYWQLYGAWRYRVLFL